MPLPDSAIDHDAKWLLERHWGRGHPPLPRRWIAREQDRVVRPHDFSVAMRRLCEDVCRRCPDLSHIQTDRLLLSVVAARNTSAYGLQARVTPMRFPEGALTRLHRGKLYQVQRYYVDGREMLYVVTFCQPRFQEQTFEEKMITVFHELYHIGTRFDGDLRRHPGRCSMHTQSKRDYDRQMGLLVQRYLEKCPEPERYHFLRYTTRELSRRHGGIVGVSVPRPKMIPVGVNRSRTSH